MTNCTGDVLFPYICTKRIRDRTNTEQNMNYFPKLWTLTPSDPCIPCLNVTKLVVSWPIDTWKDGMHSSSSSDMVHLLVVALWPGFPFSSGPHVSWGFESNFEPERGVRIPPELIEIEHQTSVNSNLLRQVSPINQHVSSCLARSQCQYVISGWENQPQLYWHLASI